MKKSKKRWFSIHTNILKIIDEYEFSNIQKNHVKIILDLMYKKYKKDKKLFSEFLEIPSTYWKKAVAEHYEVAMKILVDELGVIERNDSYSNKDHFCKKYRFKPELVENSSFKGVCYELKKKKKVKEIKKDDIKLIKETKRTLNKLKLNKRAAKKAIQKYTELDNIRSLFLVDGNIKFYKQVYETIDIENKTNEIMTGSKAMGKAKAAGKSLILYGKKLYISKVNELISRTYEKVHFFHTHSIDSFPRNTIAPSRHPTNDRLYTHITNTPSYLLSNYTLEGEGLVSLDLRNSQFVVLASLIRQGFFEKYIEKAKTNIEDPFPSKKGFSYNYLRKKEKGNKRRGEKEGRRKKGLHTYMWANDKHNLSISHRNTLINNDILLFVTLAENGKLYEYIQEHLNTGKGGLGRSKAKQMMFEICFSSHKSQPSDNKDKFKSLFPTLYEMIRLFKQEKDKELSTGSKDEGSRHFAITLQQEESRIFIDLILKGLMNQGIKALSKHDSILCKESDVERVEAFMKNILDDILGGYQLKIEHTDPKRNELQKVPSSLAI